MCVDCDFVVPQCEPWPRDIRGLTLGTYVNDIRSQASLYAEAYPKKKEILDMQEFDWLPSMTEERAIAPEERKRWFGKYSGEVDEELKEFDDALRKVESEIKVLSRELATPQLIVEE